MGSNFCVEGGRDHELGGTDEAGVLTGEKLGQVLHHIIRWDPFEEHRCMLGEIDRAKQSEEKVGLFLVVLGGGNNLLCEKVAENQVVQYDEIVVSGFQRMRFNVLLGNEPPPPDSEESLLAQSFGGRNDVVDKKERERLGESDIMGVEVVQTEGNKA